LSRPIVSDQPTAPLSQNKRQRASACQPGNGSAYAAGARRSCFAAAAISQGPKICRARLNAPEILSPILFPRPTGFSGFPGFRGFPHPAAEKPVGTRGLS